MEDTINCFLLGDTNCGKTALVTSYRTGTFTGESPANFFDKFSGTVVVNGKPFLLKVIDFTGQRNYDRIRQYYFNEENIDIFLVCFSVVESSLFYPGSFEPHLFEDIKLKWVPDIKQWRPNIPFIVVGTKSDLRSDPEVIQKLAKEKDKLITFEDGKKLSDSLGAIKYMECSAKTGKGVHEVFKEAIATVLSSPSRIFQYGMSEGHVYLTTKKLVLMGAPCVGKTAFKALLFGWPAPKHHHSTAIASRPIRAIERVTDKSEGKIWDIIETQEVLSTVRDAIQASLMIQDVCLQKLCEHEATIKVTHNKVATDEVSPQEAENSTEYGDFRLSNYSLRILEELHKKKKSSSSKKKSTKLHEATWIHVLDSGGQPQFADISRAFLRGNAINVIVFKLTEKLSDKPSFTYSLNGKVINAPSELQMTNMQLIEHFVRSISASKRTTIKIIDQEIVTKPFFIIIGTYYDEATKGIFSKREITQETIADKNHRILSTLNEFHDHLIFFNKDSNELIFPVDNLCQWNRKKISGQIRERIMAQKGVGFSVPVPVRWYVFELEMRELASSSDHGIISLEACHDIGTRLNMRAEDVKGSLVYFDALTLCLYYEKLLPDVIFTNPQYLLDMLSNVVRVSFVSIQEEILPMGKSLSFDTQRLLQEDGIFEESLLDSLDLPFVPPLFTKEHFLCLLQHISVIARINSPDPVRRYFMPVVLSTNQLTQEQKTVFSTSIDPLIITFNGKVVPQGLFPSLVVSLLSREEEPRFFIDSHSDNFPRQLRHAVKLYSDDLFGSVFLCDEHSFIEVYFTGLSEHCYLLRQVILQAVSSSATTLSYDSDTLKISGLVRCNRKHISSANDETPHPITINDKRISPVIGCSVEDLPVEILNDKRQSCWLIEPVTSCESDVSTLSKVLPEGILNEGHASVILSELKELNDWEELGIHLGLKYNVIQQIKRENFYQIETGRMVMIIRWLQGGSAVRQGLISALKTMGKNNIAAQLQRLPCE